MFEQKLLAHFRKLIIEHEEGSIAPLIIVYFTVIMSSIFVIANVASVYIARKDLIAAAEGALSKATQELDEFRYYYGFPKVMLGESSQTAAIPINCNDANLTFRRELSVTQLNSEISIVEFECNGEDLRASVSQKGRLPFELPIFKIREFTNQVEVAARSIYLK